MGMKEWYKNRDTEKEYQKVEFVVEVYALLEHDTTEEISNGIVFPD